MSWKPITWTLDWGPFRAMVCQVQGAEALYSWRVWRRQGLAEKDDNQNGQASTLEGARSEAETAMGAKFGEWVKELPDGDQG